MKFSLSEWQARILKAIAIQSKSVTVPETVALQVSWEHLMQ